jgi:hypothetical protein
VYVLRGTIVLVISAPVLLAVGQPGGPLLRRANDVRNPQLGGGARRDRKKMRGVSAAHISQQPTSQTTVSAHWTAQLSISRFRMTAAGNRWVSDC